ncbi:MAG: hypothetical protein ACLSAF_17070 [Intestinimonas sp.]
MIQRTMWPLGQPLGSTDLRSPPSAGTGLSTMLRGLNRATRNLTAIVTCVRR